MHLDDSEVLEIQANDQIRVLMQLIFDKSTLTQISQNLYIFSIYKTMLSI